MIKHYADGKRRSDPELERIKKIEAVHGVNVMSPFGTNHTGVFEDKIKDMDIDELNAFAAKVGAYRTPEPEEQKILLRNAFKAWQADNPPDYAAPKAREHKFDMRKNAHKQAAAVLDMNREKTIFETEFGSENPESFRKLLNTYSLSDLQNLSARCGYNPIYDRGRIITHLVSELEKDIQNRP